MKGRAKIVAVGAVACALLGGAVWLWIATMEMRSMAVLQTSDAARENRMLAASLLLRQHGHTASVTSSLGELAIATLPDGTLMIGDSSGVIPEPVAQQLVDWVRRGNTLVIQPRIADETDLIADYLGVRLARPDVTPKKLPTHTLTLEQVDYSLLLESAPQLLDMVDAAQPLWGDDHYLALRVYDEEDGHIVTVADNFFDNWHLQRHDHGELLLAVAGLSQTGKHITMIERLDILKWKQALWHHYKLAIISLAAGLLLLLWASVRHFGPLLPAPSPERRSLMTHIDASGAWLWKTDGGRELLLQAARADTLALMRRRAPALFRLPEHQLPSTLARLCKLSETDLIEALEHSAAHQVSRFTRQIRTLQTLRDHHER